MEQENKKPGLITKIMLKQAIKRIEKQKKKYENNPEKKQKYLTKIVKQTIDINDLEIEKLTQKEKKAIYTPETCTTKELLEILEKTQKAMKKYIQENKK